MAAECTPRATSTVFTAEPFTSLIPSVTTSTQTTFEPIVSTGFEVDPVTVVTNGTTSIDPQGTTRTITVTSSSPVVNVVTITGTSTSVGTRNVAVSTLFSTCPTAAPSTSSAPPSTTSSRPPTSSSVRPTSSLPPSESSVASSSALSTASSAPSSSASDSSSVATDDPSSSFTTVYFTSYVYADGRTTGRRVASGKSLAKKPQKSNTGAIAGGVVGGIIGLALLAVGMFLFFRRKKNKNRQSKAFTSHDLFNPDYADKPLPSPPMGERRTSKRLSLLGGAGAGAAAGAAAGARRKSSGGSGMWGDSAGGAGAAYNLRDPTQLTEDDGSAFGGGRIDPYLYSSHAAQPTLPPLGGYDPSHESSASPFDQRQSYHGPTSPRLDQPHLEPRPDAYAQAPVWGSGYVGSQQSHADSSGGYYGGQAASSSGHGHNPSFSQQYSPPSGSGSAYPFPGGSTGGPSTSTSLASVKAAEAEAARAASQGGSGLMVHEDGGRIPDGELPPPQY